MQYEWCAYDVELEALALMAQGSVRWEGGNDTGPWQQASAPPLHKSLHGSCTQPDSSFPDTVVDAGGRRPNVQ